jgi:hypothetical protein
MEGTMEFVQHSPLIEHGVRKVAVRFPRADGTAIEAFVELPLAELEGTSPDELGALIRERADVLAELYAPPSDKPITPTPDVLHVAIARLAAARDRAEAPPAPPRRGRDAVVP